MMMDITVDDLQVSKTEQLELPLDRHAWKVYFTLRGYDYIAFIVEQGGRYSLPAMYHNQETNNREKACPFCQKDVLTTTCDPLSIHAGNNVLKLFREQHPETKLRLLLPTAGVATEA